MGSKSVEHHILPRWITTENTTSSEWKYFRRTFVVTQAVEFAEILFTSRGVCGLYINGEFIESSTSRYVGRVNRHEITARLTPGENVIALKLGSSYFQTDGEEEFRRRGFWFSLVALMLQVTYTDGSTAQVVTDDTWKASSQLHIGWNELGFSDSGWEKCLAIKKVGAHEYEKLWQQAALWKEYQGIGLDDDDPIVLSVGKDYLENLSMCLPEYVRPGSVTEYQPDGRWIQNPHSLLNQGEITVIHPVKDGSLQSLVLDFERTVVGYLVIEYQTSIDVKMHCEFCYTENPADFDQIAEYREIVESLAIDVCLNPNEKTWFSLRRRAFRYLKISFLGLVEPLQIKSITLKTSVYPVVNKGWFRCSEGLLNEIWDIGRYILLVNMHQEYESCPRNEMLFFAGDGRIDGLVDFYSFGDGDLMRSSLSLDYPGGALGIAPEPHMESILWDYFCWRIISIWDYYMYWGKRDFVRTFYPGAVNVINWLIARMSDRNLIYQAAAPTKNEIVEWTCSRDRLGEKTFLNSLFYKSLLCMADLANVVDDVQNYEYWQMIATNVKTAINEYLWSEEKQAYVDSYYDYIPQDGNALAVLFKVAEPVRADKVLSTLKERLWSPYGSVMFDRVLEHTRGGAQTISTFMSTFEAEAHFMCGRQQDALDLVRNCWGTMVRKGAKTFWEFAPNDEQAKWPIPAHAWASGPAYLLPAWLLGVRPSAPGFSRVVISPNPADLSWVKGVVPTPRGLIGLSYEVTMKVGDHRAWTYALSIPRGIMETVLELSSARKLMINGEELWDCEAKGTRIAFPKGTVYEKDHRLYVTLEEPGLYWISCENGK